MKWLRTREVAERIGAKPRQVRERYALQPDFPVPSRPGGDKGHPKWLATEIDAWMETRRARVAKLVPHTKEMTSQETEDA